MTNPIRYRRAAILLIIIYAVGVAGLNSDYRDGFLVLTPINLLLTISILFLFHTDWNRSFILWSLFVFLGGFFIEVYGVASGHFFGIYYYKGSLGPNVFGVPPVIGLNWLLLSYSIGHLVKDIRVFGSTMRILTASLLMVLLDLLIEPVAMDLDFWDWEGGRVPLKNYLGWFVVSLVIFAAFERAKFAKTNPLAPFVVYVQFGFFAVMNLILYLR